MKRISEDNREQWDYDLIAPLPWEQKKQVAAATVEKEQEAFDAFYAQVTGGASG